MVDKNGASFLYKKRGVYYFSKQVPCDIKAHYSRQRVVICLKTKSEGAAERMTESLLQLPISFLDYPYFSEKEAPKSGCNLLVKTTPFIKAKFALTITFLASCLLPKQNKQVLK